jgi:hypothetical protein
MNDRCILGAAVEAVGVFIDAAEACHCFGDHGLALDESPISPATVTMSGASDGMMLRAVANTR